jgi:hypothetical protein
MRETSPKFHNLQFAFASARALIANLPQHDIQNDDQRLRLRSFVLICHAALEEYLEDLSIWVLKEARSVFRETGIVPQPLLSINAYYSLKYDDASIVEPHSIEHYLIHLCDQAVEKHETEIAMVHGIKTKDQDTVFVPLGIRIHTFDHLLSQKLHELGGMRGGFAHSFRIRQLLPRAALEQNMRVIEQLILPFDNEMCDRIERQVF